MWIEMVHELEDFSSAVLTCVDATGYPFSIRCRPKPEDVSQTLLIHLPEYVKFQPGPAWMLCHKHDESLWNLKSFTVKGLLKQDDRGWLFYPQKYIPGAGIGGLMAMVKFLLDGRRNTRRYLEKRNLSRPVIAWDTVHALWAEVHRNSHANND
jgi:hypothetical protein